jgi:gliding motility-associated-like protein
MKWSVFKYNLFLLSFFFGGGEIHAQDVIPPEKPVITYVTVDTANNNVTIFWKKSTSTDVAKYFIYKGVISPNPNEGIKIDSVPSTSTSYIHNTTGLTDIQPILYSVTALDFARNESIRSDPHSPIRNSVTYDSCHSTLTLRWNKYQGWGNYVSGYRVFARMDNGAYDTFDGLNANTDSIIIYKVGADTSIRENAHYFFYVEGIQNIGALVSTSNIAAKYTRMPLPPEELHLDYVSVSDTNTVELKYRFTEPSGITSFALLRSNHDSPVFKPVKSFYDIYSSPQIILDTIFATVDTSYYWIAALNTCGSVIETSNLGSNILLLGSHKNDGKTNILTWNPYRDFPLGTAFYEIYRLNNAGDDSLIGTVNADEISYTDDLAAIYGQDYPGKLAYRIKAVENSSSNYSLSNFCEIEVRSDIWVPNAFTPNNDGTNDIFAPCFYFIPEEYLMLIYDRYGTVVFTSKNPGLGWNGRINGNNFAPEGVYIYHVQYSSYNGQKNSQTGHVTVFYPR